MMSTVELDLEIRNTIKARLKSDIKIKVYAWVDNHNTKYFKHVYDYPVLSRIRQHTFFYDTRVMIFLLHFLDFHYRTDMHTYIKDNHDKNYMDNLTFSDVIELFAEELMKEYDKSE